MLKRITPIIVLILVVASVTRYATAPSRNVAPLTPPSQPTAPDVQSLRAQAERGDREAQSKLGFIYANGYGTQRNPQEAIKWLRAAVQNEDLNAHTQLAMMLDSGDGIEINHKEAVRLYQKPAEHGDARAQHNLAMNYLLGDGVTKDVAKAVYWFQKAADQGMIPSQTALAKVSPNVTASPADKAHR